MDFSKALEMLTLGWSLAREGWNGKDMFIYIDTDRTINANSPALKEKYAPGKLLTYKPRINIAYPCGDIYPWLASQGDLLADDWFIVD